MKETSFTPTGSSTLISEKQVWSYLCKNGWGGPPDVKNMDFGMTPLMYFLDIWESIRMDSQTQFEVEKPQLLNLLSKLIEMTSEKQGLEIVDSSGWTALFIADEYASPELLRCGSNINAVNRDGDSPAMVAAYTGHSKKLIYLLEAGSDLTFKSLKTGKSMFEVAPPECLEVLVAYQEKSNLDSTLQPAQGPLRNLRL